MKYYTYKEILDSLPKSKNSRSSIWVRNVVRKISFPITYVFINIGCSANMVSLFSWFIIFMGAVLLCFDNFTSMLIGVILTNFWLVLDCVDGNIARCKKQKSFMGDFFDAIAGYGPFAFVTVALGVASYHTSFIIAEKSLWCLILLGGSAAVANIYTRLIHQKYLNCFFAGKKIINEIDDISLADTEDKKSFAYIRERFDKEIGVSGLFMVWLFVALFTNTFDVMLIFYSLYYFTSFLAVIVIYCSKAVKFEKYAQSQMKGE